MGEERLSMLRTLLAQAEIDGDETERARLLGEIAETRRESLTGEGTPRYEFAPNPLDETLETRPFPEQREEKH